MTVLALEGALGPFSCCLDDGHRRRSAATLGSDALEAGLGLVDRLLRESGVELRSVDRIAVGTGPGSFTGLRIALSYAKALALARALPLVGISSYDALEADGLQPPVLTVVEGRTGVICARLRGAGETRLRCGPVERVIDELTGYEKLRELTVVGAPEGVLAALGERGLTVRNAPNRATIPAEAVAELASRREPETSPHAVRPDYGEVPAAQVPRFP